MHNYSTYTFNYFCNFYIVTFFLMKTNIHKRKNADLLISVHNLVLFEAEV